MSHVSAILSALEAGDPQAAAQLLPLVYDELRRLAAQKLAGEKPGQTLDATALVHEAYLKLIGAADEARWRNRSHVFHAAAEAMRRILIDNARKKRSEKRGGGRQRFDADEHLEVPAKTTDDLLAIDEALTALEAEDAQSAQLVKLRFYAGLSVEEAGDALGLPRATAYRVWSYAKAWLRSRLQDSYL